MSDDLALHLTHLEQNLQWQESEEIRLKEYLNRVRLDFIGIDSTFIPDNVQEMIISLNDKIHDVQSNIKTLKQKIGCKELKALIGADGYEAYLEHIGGDWVGYTTQLRKAKIEYMQQPTYREPKPVMHYIKNIPVTEVSPTIPPIEYYEYTPVKFQTADGHRYYLAANKEANAIVYAYVGRAS